TALSKNIKVIGDFSPQFLKVAESVGININRGLYEGITKSANEPIKAISEVAHQTIEKATEGLAKVSEIQKSFDFVSQDPLNPGEELTSSLNDWYLSHRTSFDPSNLNNILDKGLIPRPSSVVNTGDLGLRTARELELFGRSSPIYSALRHKKYGMDEAKNLVFGAVEILINPSRIANETTWFPQDTGLHRYQSLEEFREDHDWRGLHFRQLSSVSPKADLMKNYEGNAGYVEAQTHAPILPSDISAIRIGSNLASPDELYKRHGNSLLDFIRTALSKNIKVIGDFSPQFLKVAESVGININRGLSDGITNSANEPIKAISEVAHQTIEKATEGLAKVPEIHQPNPALIKQISKKPNLSESQQKFMDEANRRLAAIQAKGKDVGSGLSKGINSSLGDVKSSSEKLADTVIDTVEKKLEIQSPSKWGIRIGRFVGEGFTKGLEFLEGGNNGIIPIFIKVMNDIKSAVENGEITSSAEDFKNRLSQGFSQGLESVPGFKEAKQRFEGYKTFLKEIANPSTFAALGEGLANGIVAAKELFVDFLEIPGKLVEGFNQAKVAFDSFVEGMNKVQKFGEIMDFLKSSIGNVVKVLGLLVVGKIILDLAPASIEVATSFENLERRIRFTSGSISEGAKNIAFLRSEAKRLNVSLSQTLESGSKFFQATKDTPIEGYQSRQVVSAVTQASAVYGLDLDNQQRAFTALEQMSGKAVVSQEELRQQLAEAIPNASQVAANAYGTTTQSMNQLLSTGRVLAEDFLPKFAQQLKAQTSSGVGDAVNSSVAITNKFNNSLTELQESIGKTLLPFKNFSLGIFASGIDLVTNNFQLLQNVLLITLIKLGSPVWMMFGAYLKEIAFSGNLVKGALLGMGQSIATFAKEMFILSMAMKAIDEIMMNFKDNSGAIGEQTRNVTQSINEQRKILNQQASVTKTDDFSAFRERFSLNPFDNSTKKLKKQIEDSAKRTLEGRENTKNLLDASNSPAMQGAIREIQAIDKSLDLIKMKRRAVIANNPDNIQELRKLQSQEKELSQKREKPLELFGGNKGNLDKQVETLKTYLEYWEELKKNPKLYQSEIEQINKIISTTKDDLAIVTAEQEKMVKAIKNSLTEMQKFAIEIRNIEAKFNDVRQARDTILSLQKFNLFNYATNGVIQPGQVEYTNNLLTQVDLVSKIADNLKQVREMSAQLNINGLDDVLKSQGLNKDTGIDTLKAAQERAIDGSKEKEILTSFIEVKKMQVQTVDMQQQLSEQKYNVTQSLRQQTKQVADYYRTAVREAQAVSSEFQKAQKTLENSRMQNKLREALIGAGDNIYTQFIEGIINIISQTTEIQKQQFEARKQQIDYENNIQDIKLQASELQRSLPGKIIPIDSSLTDEFNLSLENINTTVNTINTSIGKVTNSLSNEVVDAAKKANSELDKLNQTVKTIDNNSKSWIESFRSNSTNLFKAFENGFSNAITNAQIKTSNWIESFRSNFTNLFKAFENGFSNLGNAITTNLFKVFENGFGNLRNAVTDARIKTSSWIASMATGQGAIENSAGQQLQQGAKQLISNPIGAISNFLGVDKNKILSPIQGTTVEDLLRYKPSSAQGFYGVRDGGARQHRKIDFDSRVKAGQGAEIIASLPGTATAGKWTGNSGVVFVNSLLPSGQKLTLEYGHLSLESIRKTFGGKLGKSIEVQAGQKLGNVIHDALSSGPHLDFGVRLDGKYIEPQKFLQDFMGGKYGGVVNPGKPTGVPATGQRQPVSKVPTTSFTSELIAMSDRLGINPEHILKVMMFETGGTLLPRKHPGNKLSATGLIGFTRDNEKELGITLENLAKLSSTEQLKYVEKYLKIHARGQKLDTFQKVVSTVFHGNPNGSLSVGDGYINLGNYMKKAEARYGAKAREMIANSKALDNIVMQGGFIQPNQMQQGVTQATQLKLDIAGQQY
ncbi:MAG: tape measure protein, partial [Dolichospermum sp.]